MVIRYRLGPEQTEHSYHRLYDLLHEHDGERHEHEGGAQFHYHYPGIPPGWEPAYLEG